MEKPIDDEIELDDLIATYRALVHSGAPIAEINAIRKHLSAVKGGRLAQAAYPAQQISLLVSDVPDNTPDALASGPTMPDSTSTEDCYRIAEERGLLQTFPAAARSCLNDARSRKRPSRPIRRFAIRAGGRCSRIKRWWSRPDLPRSKRTSQCMWITPAMTGTTSARRNIW